MPFCSILLEYGATLLLPLLSFDDNVPVRVYVLQASFRVPLSLLGGEHFPLHNNRRPVTSNVGFIL